MKWANGVSQEFVIGTAWVICGMLTPTDTLCLYTRPANENLRKLEITLSHPHFFFATPLFSFALLPSSSHALSLLPALTMPSSILLMFCSLFVWGFFWVLIKHTLYDHLTMTLITHMYSIPDLALICFYNNVHFVLDFGAWLWGFPTQEH